MNLLIVNGSPRKTGRTVIVSAYIGKIYGAEVVDLSTMELPMFDGEESQNSIEAVKILKEKVSQADGIILASPEYHNAMSGALKNALDFLGSRHFLNKPVALLAVAGGGKGGINALNNMRTVARGLYANAIPRQLVLDPHCFDYEGESLKEDSAKLVSQLVEELQLYTKSYIFMKSMEV